MEQMTSSKPYLVRAIHEWILDNELTPYLLVNAELPGVEVPEDFVDDGKIILNLSPEAIRNLVLDNHWCCFTAKFSNIAKDIRLPMISILAIYCQENSQGMFFDDDKDYEYDEDVADLSLVEDNDDDDLPPGGGSGSSSGSSSFLKIVK